MGNPQKYSNPEFLPAIKLIVTAAVTNAMAVAFYFNSTNQYCDSLESNPIVSRLFLDDFLIKYFYLKKFLLKEDIERFEKTGFVK
jgi:hypothetical protein